ncbi:hypothetical protein M1555_03635 [Patescibacteria group bacterium]|nr:hypothetical protein [Patescibacteria group bacterium]
MEAPFIVFGFAVLLVDGIKKRTYRCLIPVTWLLLAAVPAGLTWEDLPNVERASFMLYPLAIMSGIGLLEAMDLVRKNWKPAVTVIICAILVQNVLSFLHNYFYHGRIHEPWYRSAAEPELVATVEKLRAHYPKVVMTTERNNNLIHYLFYTAFPPSRFQAMGSPKEHDGLHFLNIVYTTNPCPMEGNPEQIARTEMNTVYVDKNDCRLPKNADILAAIQTPDGARHLPS